MNGPDKKEVARKLRAFGLQKFGTIKEFAAALGMNPVTLHSGYLNSRSLPGAGMLLKLMELGCDLHWLLANDTRHMVQSRRMYVDDDRARRLEEENARLRSVVRGSLSTFSQALNLTTASTTTTAAGAHRQ
ncbi:MAG TPA: helix-turn-helix transcriptional regulator [Bacteroidota bacterium]|nr:helix-turn-helix transcriptional regulator [Bacteroidota bacterium]